MRHRFAALIALMAATGCVPPSTPSNVNLFDNPTATTVRIEQATTRPPAPPSPAQRALLAYDSAAIKRQSIVEPNTYRGLTTVAGPTIFPDGDLTRGYFVRGWISHSAATQQALGERHQIYVVGIFSDWAFLEHAFAAGKRLDLTQIDRKVGTCSRFGCTVYEDVGINLTGNELAAAMLTGLDFEVSGRSGSLRLSIPATCFTGYYEAYGAALSAPVTTATQ